MPISFRHENKLSALRYRSLDRPSQHEVFNAVFVTAEDKSHFAEIKDAIAFVQRFYPEKRIISYDLGLKDTQRRKVGFFFQNI